jgi:hypothetical protein
MLLGQVSKLVSEHPVIDPATGFPGPEVDALLEASLVHLRLLDDFLELTATTPTTCWLAIGRARGRSDAS